MKRSGRLYIYNLIFSLFLLCFLVPEGYAQVTNISGTINSYSKVTAIIGPDEIELADNAPGFVPDEKVLIIQMKGAELSVGGSIYGSSINSSIGDYGYYEFIVIDAVSTSPDRITFKNDLLGSYDPDSYVQLVKFTPYENVLIDGPLTCDPWNSTTGTGGVLTFLADNNVYLNDNIDVSEKGFEGGISDIIQGLAIPAAGVDPDLFDFTDAENKSARKGKGIGSHIISATPFNYDDYARGKGRFGNGGGGGNGRFAGGGGGSSYATGGQGGADLDGNSYGGGFPGENALSVWVTNRYNPIVMGGGGGAGGKGSGGSDIGSDGGRGGGIIIILADTIFGNGNSIISNGESVPDSEVADNDGGAGGGGAAGAIVISSNYSIASALTITANGGNGGHTRNFNGQGGGGSGGLIFTNKDIASFGVASSVDQGEEGATNYMGVGSGIPSGFAGEMTDTLLIRLNGFLFNTIVSDVTKSRVDSICDGDSAPLIVGTTPVGGLAPYTFEWQKRTDNGSWAGLLPDTGKDLDLTVPETDTILLRRIVKDSGLGIDQIIDTSKTVTIIVQPPITGNLIGYDTIICWNQDPDALLPIDILGGGNFNSSKPDSTFSWRFSTVNSTDYESWGVPTETNDEREFNPDPLGTTTYYYRAVKSGVCYDTSNVVTVTVLPSITGNTISADQVTCEDRALDPLTGPVPGGGDGSYIYGWEIISSGTYVDADGTIDQVNYDPNQITFTNDKDTLFRRIVWSGADSVCKDISNVVSIKKWSDISGNIISSDQTITDYGTIAELTGAGLGGSDPLAIFTFKWEQSPNGVDSWADGTEINTNETYQPVGLADSTWYRRIVWRAECTDTSNIVVINVHHAIGNNTISTLSDAKDTIICNNQDPNLLVGSDPTGGDEILYEYLWEKSADGINFSNADVAGHTVIDFDPGQLTQTTYFRRKVTSGESVGYSDTITVTVLPDITGNAISGDQTICYNTGLLVPVTGPVPSGGNGAYTYLWKESTDNIDWSVDAAGVNTSINYDPGTLTVPMYYRRVVTSGDEGCCVDTSNAIMVGIYDLPIGVISAISGNFYCAGDAVTLTLDMTAAGQAPYDIVLDDGNGGSLTFTATTDSYDHTFNPVSTGDSTDYVYQFISLTDDNNCVATNISGSQNLRAYTVPVATISAATPDNICGDNVVLEAIPSVGSGLWSCPDATILSTGSASTTATTTVSVVENVTYTFTWEETNVICTNSITKDITFWEQPDQVDAGTGETLPPLTTKYALNATSPTAGSGLWTAEPDSGQEFFPEDGNLSEVSGLTDGVNVLRWTVTNSEYCIEVSDTIILTVTTLIVPSGYSPNMDGVNDNFVVKGLDNPSVKAELVVTDMAGVIVFENKEYRNEWDGRNSTSGDYLPDGTYYYFLRIKEPDARQYKGYVIIKRSIGKD